MSKPISPVQQEELFYAALLQTVSERGCGHRPIAEVTTGDVRAMARACMAQLPKTRPADQTPPGPRPVRTRPSEARDKSVVPPAPEELAAGRDCDAGECGDPSIGWRHYVDSGWLPVCTRHMTGAGAKVRALDAGQRMRFRVGGTGASM